MMLLLDQIPLAEFMQWGGIHEDNVGLTNLLAQDSKRMAAKQKAVCGAHPQCTIKPFV